jgi:hypothetical protein
MHPKLMPDETVVFRSHADLLAWSEQWWLGKGKGVRRIPDTPYWTTDLVTEFWAGIGERPRELLACAVQLGTGSRAMAFSKMLERPVAGIGRQFRQLERASRRFAHDLPAPALLNGPRGDRAVLVDPTFASAYKELFAMS